MSGYSNLSRLEISKTLLHGLKDDARGSLECVLETLMYFNAFVLSKGKPFWVDVLEQKLRVVEDRKSWECNVSKLDPGAALGSQVKPTEVLTC